MAKQTNKQMMELLHELMIKDMLSRLKEGECSSQEWATIAKFLKDNDITIAVEDNDELLELQEQMAQRRERRIRLSDKDKDEIKNNIVNFKQIG